MPTPVQTTDRPSSDTRVRTLKVLVAGTDPAGKTHAGLHMGPPTMVFNGAAGLTPFYDVLEFSEATFDTIEELVLGIDSFMATPEAPSIATILIDGITPTMAPADDPSWALLADRVMRLSKRGKNVWVTASTPVADVPDILQRAFDLVGVLALVNGSRSFTVHRSRWNARLAPGERFENFDVRQTLGALLAPATPEADPTKKELDRARQYIQDSLAQLAPKGAKGALPRTEAKSLWAQTEAAATVEEIKPVLDKVRALMKTASGASSRK